MTEPGGKVRLDRWLWAARFFKTRALASAAIAGGKVQVNGVRAKPAKQLQVGDALRIRVGPYEWVLTVRALAEHRGPARVAQTLYEESPEGRAARERLAELHKIAPAPAYRGKGRPTKKERRDIERLEGS
ncbi:MAG TPA: RNA-binding S4 domain-containing protein [Gemmatimonadales bacterium]|jgi:ribosome-associated heat shock protein Hsp15|nr:RNA-binding S4 domain-containing protein [Gemmatimonadales bacterium]